MEHTNIFSQIEKSGNLPTLPEVLIQLLEACDNEETTMGEIAAIISKDPALSLRVLQLINSAYYSLSHSFSNIEQAVVYLGIKTIRSIAVTASVHQVFEQNRTSNSQPAASEFWYHSLKCAIIAKHLSEETGLGNPDEAYMAGLLHDIGKLLLASTFSDIYSLQCNDIIDSCQRLRQESEQLGTNHSEIGSWLANQWKLGSLIVDAIQYHHEDIEQVAEAFPLVKIVFLANVFAQNPFDATIAERTSKLFFDIDVEKFTTCIETASKEVKQLASDLGIEIHEQAEKNKTDSELQDIDTSHTGLENQQVTQGKTAQETIASRVRNTSLLSCFLEDLMQAEGINQILYSFEKTMAVLLGLNQTLFFLPDSDNISLNGRTSEESSLWQISRGLTFAIKQKQSAIVQAYCDSSSTITISKETKGGSLADQQLLNILNCTKILPFPMSVNKQMIGVLIIGLPENRTSLNQEDTQLINIIIQQVGLRIFIEQEKERQATILNKERMAALSVASRKLAHEINNPLGIISNYLISLKIKLDGDSNITEDLNIINEEIQRISSLVGQMEMFSQASFTHFQEVDINTILRDVVQISKSTLFASPLLNLSFIPSSDIPHIVTSEDAIKQIIINLLKNSAEAMTEGGRVLIRTKKDTEQKFSNGSNGITIVVTDSGPGLPEHVKQNLYQPFITTKQNGHSGLGLSIIQKAVTDIGGKLVCTSSETEGTTFTIYLPTVSH